MNLLRFIVSLFLLILCGPTEEQQMVDDNEDLRQMIMSLQRENAELKKAAEAVADEKQMTADSLFLATISQPFISILGGQPIIWDSAPINPGGHFSTVLGAYTTPVDGYYQFSVTKDGNEFSGTFVFLIDEVRYAYKSAYSNPASPSGSATINIELTAGQVVRIENLESTQIFGTSEDGWVWSWFTGHLLYAL